jgi:PAS domain S-box-containing protein
MRVGPGVLSLRPNHVFWTAIFILAAVSAAAVLSTRRLIDQYSASARSHQTVLELSQLMSDLNNVESGARGYALTGDPELLESYKLGTSDLRERVGSLRELARSERSLARRLDDLERASEQRVEVASRVIRLAGNSANSSQIIAAVGASKSAMDEVRGEVGSIVAAEESAEAARTQRLQRQAVQASIALAIGAVASLLVLVWLFSRLKHEVGRRGEAELQVRKLNTELENRVQERTTEVQHARELLDAVVENLPDMILLKEPNGDGFRYLLVNAAGEALLGLSKSDIIGRTEGEIFPAGEAADTIEANRATIASGKARTLTDRTLSTPTGVRTVETRMVPIARDDGSAPLVLAIVRDVTEQKSMQTQVRQMQRLESVGRLTGGIAHDFNNLLAVIMGSVELVYEKLPKGSETAQVAEEALDAVRRGAELVRRLLAFARKQHLEPTAVNLNDRLSGIVPMLERTLGEKIRVQVKPAEQLWSARIDPTQVDDALVNLAINSRDAMAEGGTLTIETDNLVLDEDYAAQHVEVVPGEYVMLAVSDTGTGMSAEVVAQAFEPFFTTKGEGHGTGLGLSQVFGFVKQSGGHIKIYSELGHGTTVKLYLPRASEEDGRGDRPAEQKAEGRGHETILLVEDNPHVRRTAMRQLTDLGYSVIDADEAESALEKIRSGAQFDLLLTDVVMPGGMSGYELAAAAEEFRPGLNVLFTSGYTELAANGLRTARKGPLISKPYTKSDLGRAIRSALDRGRKL